MTTFNLNNNLINAKWPIKSFVHLLFIFFSLTATTKGLSQSANFQMDYIISIPNPQSHTYEVELNCKNWKKDSIIFKLPRWMPGYYQFLDYANSLKDLKVLDANNKAIIFKKVNDNTWLINGIKNKPFLIKYKIFTDKQFVANSYVDSAHAYLIPENSFLYVEGYLNTPVTVKINFSNKWKNIVTGLDTVINIQNKFTAANFDILYDCPILIGNLKELPSFKVRGIEHRFIGYNMVTFNESLFMNNLKKVVEASVDIIGDIPFKQYTFIGIGPGGGGIEHLNNTTVSFDGKGLETASGMNRIMNFLAHEYFHHYNVKRIRPVELGPFNYDSGNRSNLLWISEGLTVYYEYLIVKRGGLIEEATLFSNLENNINATENNPGRHHQSLQQASYNTWSDGPFGNAGEEKGKTISYYDKGPIVGLLLDFEIRNATYNKHSLDDVMRSLYNNYYKEKGRGFTAAEFQETSEAIAGIPLKNIFEYVYTTKELDYAKYLKYAGLKLAQQEINKEGEASRQQFKIIKIENPTILQSQILNAWMGE